MPHTPSGGFCRWRAGEGSDPDAIGLLSETTAGRRRSNEQRTPYFTAYDIPSVALQENFFPLIGLDLTWLNESSDKCAVAPKPWCHYFTSGRVAS